MALNSRFLAIGSIAISLAVGGLSACLNSENSTAQTTDDVRTFVDQLVLDADNPPTYGFSAVNSFPHDCNAFTQGLVYADDVFYEGTGLNGRSNLRKVDPATGNVLQQRDISDEYFGEGIALWEDRIIQLTWQSGKGFIYNKDSFEEIRQFSYSTEGWGITHDGAQLIMSDGTANLYIWDPESLETLSSQEIRDGSNRPVVRLNELEYIDGYVFANIWQEDLIAIIDLESGRVVAWIDLANLLDVPTTCARIDVLNGIAYDADADRLFVTGKLWPRVYQIELISQ